jgi:hypothetical protein
LESEDVEDLINEDLMSQVKQDIKPYKSMDRTEKGLINAGKKLGQKLNNKNFNIE